MFEDLSDDDRMRLVRFACSFAWADLAVGARERAWILDLLERLELDEADREQAEAWLDHPPDEEELDPFEIPFEQRELFLAVLGKLVGADGKVDPMEVESYAILASLLNDDEE